MIIGMQYVTRYGLTLLPQMYNKIKKKNDMTLCSNDVDDDIYEHQLYVLYLRRYLV